MIYAILNSDGRCINRILWDSDSDWQPPAGCTAIPDPHGLHQPDDALTADDVCIGPTREPDWTQFRQALRTENGYAPAFSAAMAADPMAGVALAIGLDAFRRDGDHADFLDALQSAFAVLPQEQALHIAAELRALAERCNLPAAFTDALASLGG